jgi:hypothetical protein
MTPPRTDGEHAAGCRYEQEFPALDPDDCPREDCSNKRILNERAEGDDLEAALACLHSHQPDVRIIGNVRAATLASLLERVGREQALLAVGRAVMSMRVPERLGGGFYFDNEARAKLHRLCDEAERDKEQG